MNARVHGQQSDGRLNPEAATGQSGRGASTAGGFGSRGPVPGGSPGPSRHQRGPRQPAQLRARGPALSRQKEKTDEMRRLRFPLPSGAGLRPELSGSPVPRAAEGAAHGAGTGAAAAPAPAHPFTRSPVIAHAPPGTHGPVLPRFPAANGVRRLREAQRLRGGRAPVLSLGPRPAAPSAGTGFASPRFSPASQASTASELTGAVRYCAPLRVGLPPGG